VRAASLPFAKSAILSAPAQAASTDEMFAWRILVILESDGCDEGRNCCDGESELDGAIDGLGIGGFVIHCIVNTLIDGE